jgi:hypothetical protein
MSNIACELKEIIFGYIPLCELKMVSVVYFLEAIKNKVNKDTNVVVKKNYLRFIIRKDLIYPLKYIMRLDCGIFKEKRVKFERISYPSYIIYLKEKSLENKSQKCYQYIINYIRQKKYKKIRRKNSRWSN